MTDTLPAVEDTAVPEEAIADKVPVLQARGAVVGGVRVVMLPGPLLREAVTVGPAWRVLGHRILDRSKDLCPVGKNTDVTTLANGVTIGYSSAFGSSQGHGSLKESMEVRFAGGADPNIAVGSTLTRGDSGVSALGLILEGTDPHEIAATNAKALLFSMAGEAMFRVSVQHPGTKKNPFVQRAMQQVCLEAARAG